MNADVAYRWESTHLVEAVYALKRGLARWLSMGTNDTARVPEKIVSKPPTPKFFELDIPLFRFISYPGGKSVLTPTTVAAAEARLDDLGVRTAWDEHHASQSGNIFQTKRTGYLERAPRVSKDVVAAAQILWEEIGVDRAPALEAKIINPVSMTYRVYSAELADERITALAEAAASGQPIKFKGQPHTVTAVQGGWNVLFNRFDVNYDLQKVRK